MNNIKPLILFFTGTGNSEYVAKRFEDFLKEEGVDSSFLSVDKIMVKSGQLPGVRCNSDMVKSELSELIEGVTDLVLVFPAYASDIPLPMKEIVRLLPRVNGVKLSTIVTCGAMAGDLCRLPGKILKTSGYIPLVEEEVLMPTNLCVPGFAFTPVKNGDSLTPFHFKVEEALRPLVKKLVSRKAVSGGGGVKNFIIGRAQRLLSGVFYKRITSSFFVDDSCTKCNRCVHSCPTGNIVMTEAGPLFGDRCAMCMRCYNFCPVAAIQLKEQTENRGKFVRYRGFNGWTPPDLYGEDE